MPNLLDLCLLFHHHPVITAPDSTPHTHTHTPCLLACYAQVSSSCCCSSPALLPLMWTNLKMMFSWSFPLVLECLDNRNLQCVRAARSIWEVTTPPDDVRFKRPSNVLISGNDKWFTRLTAECSFIYLAINNSIQSEPPLEICLLLCVYYLFIH